MWDGREDLLPQLLRQQLRPLLLARRAEVPRRAGESDEELAPAAGAPYAGETILRAAAIQIALDDALHHRAQRAVLVGEPLLVRKSELGEVLVDRSVKARALGMAGSVDGRGVANAALPIPPPPPRGRRRRQCEQRRHRGAKHILEHPSISRHTRDRVRQEGRISPRRCDEESPEDLARLSPATPPDTAPCATPPPAPPSPASPAPPPARRRRRPRGRGRSPSRRT